MKMHYVCTTHALRERQNATDGNPRMSAKLKLAPVEVAFVGGEHGEPRRAAHLARLRLPEAREHLREHLRYRCAQERRQGEQSYYLGVKRSSARV